jgi:L-ascorbate metabolism protein UlaG (beta-lactamase superfamily)
LKQILALVSLLLLTVFLLAQPQAYNCPSDSNIPAIRYLGVGALDIRYQGQRILTDPFYSPQTLWDIASFTPYTPHHSQIKKVLGTPNQSVNTVLIGHGHYDHAADVPAITGYLTPDAQIISSKSTQFLLASKMQPSPLKGLNNEDFGKWITIANGWIRIMATPSEHAPQALGINLFPHNHDHALEDSPKYVWHWTQGTNINWLVDFLAAPNSKTVVERIFLQTSASAFPIGVPDIQDSIEVKKVFLAAASFDHVDNYPTGLIEKLEPNNIIFIHWENFFKSWFEQPDALSLIDFDKLMSNNTLANRASDALIGQPGFCY